MDLFSQSRALLDGRENLKNKIQGLGDEWAAVSREIIAFLTSYIFQACSPHRPLRMICLVTRLPLPPHSRVCAFQTHVLVMGLSISNAMLSRLFL